MTYIALKPCEFAGQKFKIGDTIPGGYILPGAAKNLIKMEKIAPADASRATMPVPNGPIAIRVQVEEGDMELNLSDIGLQQIFDALTANVEGAEKVVEVMTDGEALILLHMSDSRKSIKAAAEARAKALEQSEEVEESEDSAGEE